MGKPISRFAIYAVGLVACRSQPIEGAPPAADSEHRGIAIAPPPTDLPTNVPAPIAMPQPTRPSSSGDAGAFDRARKLYLQHDLPGARAALEEVVFVKGSASRDEVQFLRDICKEQGDRQCMDRCQRLKDR